MTASGDALLLAGSFFEVARAAGASVHSAAAALGERAPSAAEAVRRAAEGAARAAVVLLPGEVPGALAAIADASIAHAPVVIHVAFAPGDDASPIAPLCESGAAVVSTWSADEASFAAVALHRAAHDSEMPFVHVYDAPEAGAKAAALPAETIEALLGGAPARSSAAPPAGRAHVRSFAGRVPFALAAALRSAGERRGRAIPLLERCETADADEVIVTYGRTFAVACDAAKAARAAGRKVGVLGVRALRPFLSADVVKAIARAKAAVVIEPLDAALDPTGPLAACVKGAFFDALTWAPGFPGVGRVPPIVSVTSALATIGAADVERALSELSSGERARRVLVLGSDG
jgi:pyruvate-ferredoxin/flavodoxin oxidoreductase